MHFWKFLDDIRMKSKLRGFYLFTCTVPIAVLGLLIVFFSRDQLLKQCQDTASVRHINNKSTFALAAYLATDVSSNIQINAQLRRLLTTDYPNEVAAVAAQRQVDIITQYLRSYPEFAYIWIYTYNASLRGTPYPYITEEIEAQPWFQAAADSHGTLRWYITDLEHDSRLQLVRKMPLVGDDFAVIVIGLSDTYFKLQFSGTRYDTILLLDNKPFFAVPGTLYNDDWQTTFDDDGQLLRTPASFSDSILLCDTILLDKCINHFTVLTADRSAPSSLRAVMLSLLMILFILLLAAFLLIYLFTYMIDKRIVILQRQMRSINDGKLKIQDALTGEDDLGQLFNDMVRTIQIMQDLNQSIYEKELREQKNLRFQKELEYKLLANQVNPHFLFNTMESIHMKAILNDDREVARMIRKLSVFLRRMLQTPDKTVLLSGELDLIRGYLDIQQFRHERRFSYELHIDGSVNPARQTILPLLLLPIVENAVLHGLDHSVDNGHVQISVFTLEDALHISVCDNGTGMHEESCRALRTRMNQSGQDLQGQSIGLYNVNQRIKLYYGCRYGVDIQSELGVGTVIDLILPLDRSEENP